MSRIRYNAFDLGQNTDRPESSSHWWLNCKDLAFIIHRCKFKILLYHLLFNLDKEFKVLSLSTKSSNLWILRRTACMEIFLPSGWCTFFKNLPQCCAVFQTIMGNPNCPLNIKCTVPADVENLRLSEKRSVCARTSCPLKYWVYRGIFSKNSRIKSEI